MKKIVPFDLAKVTTISNTYPTPFYLYDETGIRLAATKLNQAFSWNKGFKNYFAVKALPNPKILEILKNEAMGFDCSSLTELVLVEKVHAKGDQIMFSSNDTAPEEFVKAAALGAIINLDDISHLGFLEEVTELPELLCFRYNPGNLIQGNTIIGHPEEAKFGMTREQVLEAVKVAKKKGVKRFGLHIMAISNNLNHLASLEIVKVLFELAAEIEAQSNVQMEFINLGGGIGIPYKPDDLEFDVDAFSAQVKRLLKETLSYEPKIFMECGRYITGPYGYLISKVQHIKRTYKTFIGLDAAMQNLMRPGMYGAYHHITVLGKDSDTDTHVYDVTGSLCENNDKFAVDRLLPEITIGDYIVIHDAGAHGHSMGFNYNGKLRCAELLLHADASVERIRRAETIKDYLVTLS